MEESVTYQAIIRKGRELGRVEGIQRMLLLQGGDKFGSPTAAVSTAIESIGGVGRLEQLAVRLGHVATWEELLELPPAPIPRPRRRKPKT